MQQWEFIRRFPGHVQFYFSANSFCSGSLDHPQMGQSRGLSAVLSQTEPLKQSLPCDVKQLENCVISNHILGCTGYVHMYITENLQSPLCCLHQNVGTYYKTGVLCVMLCSYALSIVNRHTVLWSTWWSLSKLLHPTVDTYYLVIWITPGAPLTSPLTTSEHYVPI